MSDNVQSAVCAGIVTFNPDLDVFENNIAAIIGQVGCVYVCDNGSANIDDIRSICDRREIRLIENGENLGIATALNKLCAIANDDGYSWILTLDQDSECESDLVEKLYRVGCANEWAGIVCPEIDYRGIPLKQECTGDVDAIEACMTSASLTNLSAWESIGGFDEWMFIDMVDNDFCINMRLHGYSILRVRGAVLHHTVGNPTVRRLPFGRQLICFNHSPFRNYYIVRNTIYLMKKYGSKSKRGRTTLQLIYGQSVKLLFESGRRSTVASCAKGLVDGMRKTV